MDRGTWGPDGPPDEAYSRVSDPTRYLALHPTADRLVEHLVSRFRVAAEPAEAAGPWREVVRATRLVPEGGGAPLTLFWTGCGVAVRAGHAFERGFPDCGCDACDEDADELVEDLEKTVEAVAAGGLTEVRSPRWLRADETAVSLRWAGGSRSTGGALTEPRSPLHAIPVGTTTWPPWPVR